MKAYKSGQIWISVIIYTMVAVVTLSLILNVGMPILTEMKERAAITKVREVMIDIDKYITEISNQGEGAQSGISFDIRDGEISFENDQMAWEIETSTRIISPRSSSILGNLIISSNANVNAIESSDHYLLHSSTKTDNFTIRINKKGSEDAWETYNISSLIEYISFNGQTMAGDYLINLNNNESTSIGTGYTKLIPSGNNSYLGRAKVIAHMNSTFAEYDVEFTLESYSDFLTIEIKNFRNR